MDATHWQRQESDKPLFSDLIWARPEHKGTAGKLLVIGGNLHAFSAPAEAFNQAEKAGVGRVRVMLPDATRKIVGRIMEHVEYGPSTPSGSFGQRSLSELLDTAAWADGVLFAGDLGKNSETAILIEKFTRTYTGQLTLTKDAADYAVSSPDMVANRHDTLLVVSFAQLQRLAVELGFTKAFTFDMDLLHLVDALSDLTKTYAPFIIVKHLDQIHCAANGRVISTKRQDTNVWRIRTATHAAVWWLQNPGKPLEALATSLTTQANTNS